MVFGRRGRYDREVQGDLSGRVLVYEYRHNVPSALRTEVQGVQRREPWIPCLLFGHAVGDAAALSERLRPGLCWESSPR